MTESSTSGKSVPISVAEFHAYVVDTDEDIETIQTGLGLEVMDSYVYSWASRVRTKSKTKGIGHRREATPARLLTHRGLGIQDVTMPKHPFWKALEDAEKGSDTEAKMLYTRGGCHAYAFAQAVHLKGTAVLMTKIAVPAKGGSLIKPTIHAWCIAGSAFIDYYGTSDSEEELLARLHKEGSWSPAFTKGTRSHTSERFSVAEVRLALSRNKALPTGYFNEPDWLQRAMALTSRSRFLGNITTH